MTSQSTYPRFSGSKTYKISFTKPSVKPRKKLPEKRQGEYHQNPVHTPLFVNNEA